LRQVEVGVAGQGALVVRAGEGRVVEVLVGAAEAGVGACALFAIAGVGGESCQKRRRSVVPIGSSL
jgi:hypothetical protein